MLATVGVLLALSLITRPIDHDEGQYVAAVALMRDGWPYVDFAYLQTPLQPLVLAPLSTLPAGWLLVGVRIANALFALSGLAMLLLTVRGRAPIWAALAAAGGFACTDVFLFAGSVARNDALPMALLAGAGALLVQYSSVGRWGFAGAGLFLGLAASAKISFALPAAGAGVYLLWRVRSWGWTPFLLSACGGLVGLLPTIMLAVAAPERFYFDVFTYNLEAPQQWWASIGLGNRLTPSSKLMRLLKFASLGPILVALVVVALDRKRSSENVLLDWMLLGGLFAAYLPDPAFRQYLAPALPPLFARFALSLAQLGARKRQVVLTLTTASAIVGVIPTIGNVVEAARNGNELAGAVGQAREVAKLAAGQTIVTLSPERVAGADTVIDRGFVTGPFLFRTEGALAANALRLGYSPNWQQFAATRAMPGAILVGGEKESRSPRHSAGLDATLIRWAQSRHYRELRLEKGFTLFLSSRPSASGSSR